MKKLIRWHYKEYLIFLFITIIGCVAFFEQDFAYRIVGGYYEFDETWFMDMELDGFMGNIFQFYFETLFLLLTGSVLVQKTFHYWSLKDEYGRCYFGSLPFKKEDYCVTAFLRDLLTILITILVITVYIDVRFTGYLETKQIYIPWMSKSLIGLAVITGGYLIFLLGIYNILESLFVNGIMKLFGSLGILGVGGMILETLMNRFPQNSAVVDCYGFLTMTETAGNCYLKEYSYRGEIYHTFIHQMEKVPYLFKGKEIWYMGDYGGEMDFMFEEKGTFCRLFDFSLSETYLLTSVIYLILGLLLAGCALWLTRRQEESKSTFYHAATKYILCVLLAAFVFVMSYENDMSPGRICMAIVPAVAVLVLAILLIGRKTVIKTET